MARRYARDNRGRFASVGATARGGRLRTAAGNKRAKVTTNSGLTSQGRLTGAPLKSTIGKTGKARLNMGLTRPSKPGQREAYNTARTSARASKAAAAQPAATKGSRLGGARRTTRAAAPKNTTANNTGQSKTLNKYNSRPEGTKILNAKNQLVASPTRVALRVAGPGSRGSDRAFARVATKTARARAASKTAALAAPPKTQKERWAARSAMLKNAAARNEAKAKSMFDAANTAGNTAFNTQPGRLAGRARMNAQTERSFRLQEKAAQQKSRAANLERMANTNKGDAAKGRAQKAAAVKASHTGLKKGDQIEGTLYGMREVVKVNAKSVTVKGGVKNFTIPWEFIKPKR